MMRFLVALLGLLLVGCATGPLSVTSGPLGDLTKLTTADLTAALADATAHNDQAAMQCYPVLMKVVASLPAVAPASQPAGVVSAFQAARDLVKTVQAQTDAGQGSVVQAVNLGCAALFNDAQGDVLRLLNKIRP